MGFACAADFVAEPVSFRRHERRAIIIPKVRYIGETRRSSQRFPAIAALWALSSSPIAACTEQPQAAPWTAAGTGPSSAEAGVAEDPTAALLIPARVRRLSNAEYNGSVAALLAAELTPARDFTPDARQAGFTVNEAQRVDAVLAKQLYAAAEQLAIDARPRIAQLAPCDTPEAPEACARAFIADFGERAYRRPLLAEESDDLLELFRAGAEDAQYADGIELVIRALLQSVSFLYLTELGDAAVSGAASTALTQFELASALAYLMTGAPPDRALLDAAHGGELTSAEVRRAQLLRLRREHPASRDHLVRTLREWLELDRIEYTAKDIAFYPAYETFGSQFSVESRAFIGAVLDLGSSRGDVTTLLAADWTLGDSMLASFYDARELGDGRLQLAARRGILNQGAFLAVHAHAYESAPVLRGAAIARRLACIAVPAPTSVGINPVPPASNPKLTTRQRFASHDADPSCAQCHKIIDSFGNAFEEYDGMGALRQVENDVAIDSTTVVSVGADFDGAYADGNELALALAKSPAVHECFARHLFRAVTGRSLDSARAQDSQITEEAFIADWRALSEVERGNVVDTLSAFVVSRLFTHRRVTAP